MHSRSTIVSWPTFAQLESPQSISARMQPARTTNSSANLAPRLFALDGATRCSKLGSHIAANYWPINNGRGWRATQYNANLGGPANETNLTQLAWQPINHYTHLARSDGRTANREPQTANRKPQTANREPLTANR